MAHKDQNTFKSKIWGKLTFVETGSSNWWDNCKRCPLWKPRYNQTEHDECLFAPCTPEERYDGKHGYFAKQDKPN